MDPVVTPRQGQTAEVGLTAPKAPPCLRATLYTAASSSVVTKLIWRVRSRGMRTVSRLSRTSGDGDSDSCSSGVCRNGYLRGLSHRTS
jgi:hypothetical protein